MKKFQHEFKSEGLYRRGFHPASSLRSGSCEMRVATASNAKRERWHQLHNAAWVTNTKFNPTENIILLLWHLIRRGENLISLTAIGIRYNTMLLIIRYRGLLYGPSVNSLVSNLISWSEMRVAVALTIFNKPLSTVMLYYATPGLHPVSNNSSFDICW